MKKCPNEIIIPSSMINVEDARKIINDPEY